MARALPCVLSALLLLLSVRGVAAPAGTFELVYTAPVETTLQRPGLRAPPAVWQELFDHARESIDIAQFYVTSQPGEPLEPVIAHLARAGERGVRIRFLVEKKMLAQSQEGLALLRRIPHLEVRVIDWAQAEEGEGGILHAKYILADRRSAYLGSNNFDWRSLKHIMELGLRITDPDIVAGMQAIFDHDWQLQERLSAGQHPVPLNRQRPAARTDRTAYLVASPFALDPPGVGDSEGELVRLIGTAQKELRVQLLDYAPLSRGHRFYPVIDNALRAAAVRGVNIKLLVSHWNTDRPAIDHLKSLAMLPGVEVRIATVPQAQKGFIPYARVIHAKYMVLDGRLLWLGTSNWTGGYLDHSRNLEVVVQDPVLAQQAFELHDQLWRSSYSEKLDLMRDYPPPRRR